MDDRKYDHPNFGTDFDWLAVDSVGHVGVFDSGYGKVPLASMEHAAELDATTARFMQLPIVGACAESPTGPGICTFWLRWAERGVFGYDWTNYHGPYQRMTVPSVSLTVDDLPDDFARLANMVVLTVDFMVALTIEPEEAGAPIAYQ